MLVTSDPVAGVVKTKNFGSKARPLNVRVLFKANAVHVQPVLKDCETHRPACLPAASMTTLEADLIALIVQMVERTLKSTE